MEKNKNTKIGAVLVQGGGVAGIQATLDLANSGFKVYLVERDAAIGGMMSQLDKTFPTGDCATCIVSPKLVECARNLNIEILTLSELTDLQGEPGNFKATVVRHPRYVNESKCTACAQCTDACPVNISNEFERGLGSRKAIAKPYAQATPNIFSVIKNGHSPCKIACPANVNVQGYVQLIKKKEYIKAVDLIRERNPLSAICGRVCTHPCEAACARKDVDSAVAIRLLKRFASDKEMEMVASGKRALPAEKKPTEGAKKVAVVGAGPSGLTAARDLADAGYAVTIYESAALAGGMLRWGIPQYRLPKNILDYEIELIRRKGVKFIFNCRVGKDISFEQLRKENEAVYLSVGAQTSRQLSIEGEDKKGVVYATDFLRQAASANARPQVKGKVVVIGGGNVAVDSARTAIRLGAHSVELVCLEQRDEMPALPEEINATLEERISISNGWGPRRIIGNGAVTGIELKSCVSVFDQDKRFNPVYDEMKLTFIDADQIIVAIGQGLEKEFSQKIGVYTERGWIKSDRKTLQTNVPGVFAGGDSVSGPTSVIDAVAAGKRATESIDRYLHKEELLANRWEDSLQPLPDDLLPTAKGQEKKIRAQASELPISERWGVFTEVENTITEEAALAEAERCLNCAMCSECLECVKACEQNAIDHFMGQRTLKLDIGAVILAPGFEEFAAAKKGEFGFGRYPNVLTSVQFERMLSASGPFEGHVIRRSDGGEAKRIAWIQCVGSRDERCGNDYCSSVCCMVSTKQALIATDHTVDLKATVFYMDIRAHGKDFDQYFERAKSQGIDYIHSTPSRIVQMPGTKALRIQFATANGKAETRDFDLVILSVGMEAGLAAKASAAKIGVELNEFGFCATDRFRPVSTSRPGVYVAGSFQEPKDIPETVTQASAAASMAQGLLAYSRNSLVVKKVYPGEHDVTGEEPRIGVFICHCGKNIASVVDVERVAAIAAKQPGVVYANHTMYTCSDTSLHDIRKVILEQRLNRVVVASCTPRTHEPIFRDTLREAGLNSYLFELTNIRDQCSWVHSSEPEKATEKAIELVKMSIGRARLLAPLQESSITVDQTGLVVGGGLSGMTAALALADQGFKTYLVEKSDCLGGNLHELKYTLEHEDVAGFTAELIDRVKTHPNIDIFLYTEIKGVSGFIGNFQITLLRDTTESNLTCGAIIVATGAVPAQTEDFLFGKARNVITQTELEKQLYEGKFAMHQNVVMIQCAGSRNSERRYCSRLCCAMAIKNALRIKKADSSANIFVFYRDIRTYGFREKYYKQAREAGVLFIRYNPENPPVITPNKSLTLNVESPDLPEDLQIEADTVVLSTGVAAPANRSLADLLKVPLNSDGFFLEAHLKLRPVEFTTEGIYLCGLAHSPKMMDENITQAKAAAARAATVLSKTKLEVSGQVSWVDQSKCISCATCIRVCPYGSPELNKDKKAEIVAAKCMGCGICASECPANAIHLSNFETTQFKAMIDELFRVEKTENTGVPAGITE